MDVVLGNMRDIKVNDMTKLAYVNTASKNICGNEKTIIPSFKPIQRLVSLYLAAISMYFCT
jgi:hypothetical protein